MKGLHSAVVVVLTAAACSALGAYATQATPAPPAKAAAAMTPASEGEARISLDVKDADITDIVRLLAEVAGFQVVFDPGVSCKLTLKLTAVRWPAVLDAGLRSCGLARDEQDGILRIATAARLMEEARQQRQLEEERRLSAPRTLTSLRLSYARAEEMAALVKRFLSARGEVVYDKRTNTLIVID
jgi:type IV pilus assembly protein PilQ